MKCLFLTLSIFLAFASYGKSQGTIPPEARFQRAQALAEAGESEAALSIYDRLLVENWNRDLVYLEKALVLEHMGRNEEAAALYQHVLAQNPPEEVKKNIEARLAGISSAGGRDTAKSKTKLGKALSGLDPYTSVSLGYFYDSNVNAGPASSTIFIFNLPFALSPDAQETSAQGYQFQLNSGATKRLGGGRAISGSFGYNRIDYSGISRFDFDSLRARIEYISPLGRGSLGLPVGYTANFLGSRFYSQSVSFSPYFRRRLSQKLESISSLYASYNTYGQVKRRTGYSTAISQRLRWHNADGSQFVELNASYGHEFANVNFLSSDQIRLALGGYTNLPLGFNLYVAPGFQYVRYNDADPFFGQDREEPQFNLNVNLGNSLGILGLDYAIGYTYTKTFANLDLYKFSRHQVSFTLHREF